ncbi:hypothetical protein ACU8KH_00415 [Lachancea thermotolerans]
MKCGPKHKSVYTSNFKYVALEKLKVSEAQFQFDSIFPFSDRQA